MLSESSISSAYALGSAPNELGIAMATDSTTDMIRFPYTFILNTPLFAALFVA
jgi:hypothetical protein